MIPKPANSPYEVAIVGLGYVGIPLAVGFAEAGCRTLGFDLDHQRIDELQAGRSPITTISSERIAASMAKKLLAFTSDKSRLSESEARRSPRACDPACSYRSSRAPTQEPHARISGKSSRRDRG